MFTSFWTGYRYVSMAMRAFMFIELSLVKIPQTKLETHKGKQSCLVITTFYKKKYSLIYTGEMPVSSKLSVFTYELAFCHKFLYITAFHFPYPPVLLRFFDALVTADFSTTKN